MKNKFNINFKSAVIGIFVIASSMIVSACSSIQSSQQKQTTQANKHLRKQGNKKFTNSEILQAYKEQRQQLYRNNRSVNHQSVKSHTMKKQAMPNLQSKQDMSGYTTTDSGLKYKVMRQGTGKSPTAKDTVSVHYEGKLTNGKVFDSSYQRNEPTTIPLNHVIAGWTEGLQLAKEGGKYEFYIPANLAYGSHGAGNNIPPNSSLIFMVELIEVK